MRLTPIVLAALCAACATTGGMSGPSSTASAPEVATDDHGNVIRTIDAAASTNMNAAPAEVVRALAEAYTVIGVAADIVDAGRQVVARTPIAFSRRLKGERLSALFDCGQGQFGPRADDGRVTVSVSSRVTGASAPVRVSTQVEASLMPNDGASSSRVRCGSRGVLEERIRRVTLQHLGLPDVEQGS